MIGRCCAKQIAVRYSTASDLASDLRTWLASAGDFPEAEPKDGVRRYAAAGNSGKIAAPPDSIWKRLAIMLGTMIVLGLAVGIGWMIRPRPQLVPASSPPTTSERPEQLNTAARPSEPRLHGYLDIRVWPSEKENGEEGNWLEAPGVLPLRTGNYVEAHAEMSTGPAYMYVVWLESGGDAVPIYPWQNGSWEELPEQAPREFLRLPGPLAESPPGVETLVFLARHEPLTPAESAQIANLFSRLPTQESLSDPELRVWMENGVMTRDRGAIQMADANGAADVISDLQLRLRSEELQELFPYSRTVSFSFQGTQR